MVWTLQENPYPTICQVQDNVCLTLFYGTQQLLRAWLPLSPPSPDFTGSKVSVPLNGSRTKNKIFWRLQQVFFACGDSNGTICQTFVLDIKFGPTIITIIQIKSCIFCSSVLQLDIGCTFSNAYKHINSYTCVFLLK